MQKSEVSMKRLLISELAKTVGLHPETLRRLERRGLITSFKRSVPGTDIFISPTLSRRL